MIADKLVQCEVIAAISHDSIRRTFKNTHSNRGSRNHGA
jgi:hypothetical protein